MAYKKEGTADGTGTKKYFWRAADFGNGLSRWHYVTPDATATCEAEGYFDDEELAATLRPGDELYIFRVASLDDTRPVHEDIAGGLTDISRHFVTASGSGGVEITADLESATLA
jgi:hypothetical protein